MPRPTRSSVVANNAALRLSNLRSIHANLQFDKSLNLAEYEARIQALRSRLANYNSLLMTIDHEAEQIALQEKDLRAYSEKMLMSVVTHYGKDSLEYIQAGGKPRKSKRTQVNAEALASSVSDPQEVAVPSAEKAKTNGGVKAGVN
jgi:hypothetical protein